MELYSLGMVLFGWHLDPILDSVAMQLPRSQKLERGFCKAFCADELEDLNARIRFNARDVI